MTDLGLLQNSSEVVPWEAYNSPIYQELLILASQAQRDVLRLIRHLLPKPVH
jgi:hypothetical protein